MMERSRIKSACKEKGGGYLVRIFRYQEQRLCRRSRLDVRMVQLGYDSFKVRYVVEVKVIERVASAAGSAFGSCGCGGREALRVQVKSLVMVSQSTTTTPAISVRFPSQIRSFHTPRINMILNLNLLTPVRSKYCYLVLLQVVRYIKMFHQVRCNSVMLL